MKSPSKPSLKNEQKFKWATVIYYYCAMILCLVIFFAGANLATHGLLRAIDSHRTFVTDCLPPPGQAIDSSKLLDIERTCSKEEQNTQIRQGLFQVGQGLTMAVIAGLVFAWHFRRIRLLELNLSSSLK